MTSLLTTHVAIVERRCNSTPYAPEHLPLEIELMEVFCQVSQKMLTHSKIPVVVYRRTRTDVATRLSRIMSLSKGRQLLSSHQWN